MVYLDKQAASGIGKGTKPWWNRPLIGDRSLWERVTGRFHKHDIPAEVQTLHQEALNKALRTINRAIAIDNEKFGNPEFLAYVRIKHALAQGSPGYANLEQYVNLLQVGLQTQQCFLSLEQIEIKHQGRKFRDFFDFVEASLAKLTNPTAFKVHLEPKFSEIYPQMQSEEGRSALRTYVSQLEALAEHRLGLKLLAAFKANQMTDYSSLRQVSDLIRSFRRQDLLDFKGLTVQVISHYAPFESLGKVIGVPAAANKPETYARMLQYIALMAKHEVAFPKFQEMVGLLQEWQQYSETVQSIRAQYQKQDYRQVKAFMQKVPGQDLFEKYQDYFS